MQVLRTAATAAGISLCFQVMPAAAQIDYRNLDDDRPVVTEDAYPVERYAFELLAPYRFEAEAGGGELHSAVAEVAYGFLRNAQLGLKLPLAAVDEGTDTEWGLAGVRVFGLYNFNTESRALPALSLRADAELPVGSLAGEGTRLALKAIATRSWGRMRVHLNASRGFGSEDALSSVEPLPRWSASLAVDRTFFRTSLLLIGEIATAQLADNAASDLTASLGARWQWTPTLVLDFGVTRRLSDAGPDVGLTLGVSHAFAIKAFMPRGSP
jgi:Putative MetA-pathway of phenol degradation